MQIQYFERLNPEMECIYLLERRYQAGEDAPHSIPALRDHLSGKYNIPMFELEAMLQPLIDLENYVVSNLQVSEERLRFFFSSRGGTTSALARPLYAVLHSRPHYGSLRRPKSSARSSACWPACSGWRRRTSPGSTASTLSSASCCKARRLRM